MCILAVFVSLLILFFNTEYKRQNADKKKQPTTAIARGLESSTTISSSVFDSQDIKRDKITSELETRRNSENSATDSVDMFHTTAQ